MTVRKVCMHNEVGQRISMKVSAYQRPDIGHVNILAPLVVQVDWVIGREVF